MPVVSVQIQALDDTWQTCGPDSPVKVPPESVECVADSYGSKTASFELKRDPAAPWPDIGPFTPVKVFADNELVWSGRTNGTPSRDGTDRVMSVQCVGWQAHLDDDLVTKLWVHTRMADWKNGRDHLDANLATLPTDWGISTNSDTLSITYPANTAANGSGLAFFDAGPGRTIKKITWKASSNTWGANNSLYVLSGDTFAGLAGADFYNPGSIVSGTGYTDGWTLPTARRFVAFRVDSNSHTPSSEEWLKFERVVLFGDAAYESSGVSVLKASDVVRDAISLGTVKLSSDLSGVEDTSFEIPEFAPDARRTPRELIQAVNSFHGWDFHLDVNRRPVFKAMPDRPALQLGSTSGYQLEDSDQGAADDIYNGVVVTGTDPAGQPVVVERYARQASGGFTLDPDCTLSNPSFDIDTSGWTAVSGTLGRTTTAGQFDSGPAGGSLAMSSGLGSAKIDTTGNPDVGCTYKLTCKVKASGTLSSLGFARVKLQGASGAQFSPDIRFVPGTSSFETRTIYYTPNPGDAGSPLTVWVTLVSGGSHVLYIDSLELTKCTATVVDRRGFLRRKELQLGFTVPSDGIAAAQIGDVWLNNHITTGFRGTATVTGPAVEDRMSAQKIPAASLLTRTNELLHFADRIDPITGAAGRNARLAEVSWKADTDTASLALDSKLGNLDELLGRLAVVMGQPA